MAFLSVLDLDFPIATLLGGSKRHAFIIQPTADGSELSNVSQLYSDDAHVIL